MTIPKIGSGICRRKPGVEGGSDADPAGALRAGVIRSLRGARGDARELQDLLGRARARNDNGPERVSAGAEENFAEWDMPQGKVGTQVGI